MKKKIAALLLTAFLAFLMSGGALAADRVAPDSAGVYTVRYTKGVVDGRQYILRVVLGTESSYSVDDASVLYIDRTTAANGQVRISFIPSRSAPAVVLLYGEFSDDAASPAVVGTISAPNNFTDISGHWAEDSIYYLTGLGYMTGVSNTLFDPETPMSRAMLVTVLYRIDGMPKVSGTLTFGDVRTGQWYTDAVLWATQNKLVTGYDAARFGTGDNVTREQIASILYRYAHYKGYDVSKKASLSGFLDASKVSSWAADQVAWANAAGILSGITSTALSPGDTAGRAQVAVMLTRFLRNAA